MDLPAFLDRFTAVRQLHPGDWTAQCPAHEDRSQNTLSLALGAEGRRLVYCWAGCDTLLVLAAVGLTESDLFVDDWVGPPAMPTTYDEWVRHELVHVLAERHRRYGPYRGESHASAAIRREHELAAAARTIAARPDLTEAFMWELLECASEWEREGWRLEAEQDERLRVARRAP